MFSHDHHKRAAKQLLLSLNLDLKLYYILSTWFTMFTVFGRKSNINYYTNYRMVSMDILINCSRKINYFFEGVASKIVNVPRYLFVTISCNYVHHFTLTCIK